MEHLLCQAIRQRRVLILRYKGYRRHVEPHVFGLGRDGVAWLRAWQCGGDSDGGETEGWKLMRAEDLGSVEMTEMRFERRADYRRRDPAIVQVACQV